MVERKTLFVVLCRMDSCPAAPHRMRSTDLTKLAAFLRESLTYDCGSEMACHADLAKRLDIDIWFADPYAPWQRGSKENTNGLLRPFLPKGTDLSTVSRAQLNDIARLLNVRPRETSGWNKPKEALAKEMELYKKSVLHLILEAALSRPRFCPVQHPYGSPIRPGSGFHPSLAWP